VAQNLAQQLPISIAPEVLAAKVVLKHAVRRRVKALAVRVEPDRIGAAVDGERAPDLG
jgi:hypothetical protein